MLEVIQYIFSDFVRWLGALIMLSVVAHGLGGFWHQKKGGK